MLGLLALPALEVGAKIFTPTAIWRYINLALGLIATGIDVAERLKILNDHIQQMVNENRDPTDAEFDAIFAQRDQSHTDIQTS